MTPQHYIAANTAGFTGFRDLIVDTAKRALTLRNASGISTAELSNLLWPTHLAHGTQIDVRKKMVDVLLKCAQKELSMCARRGPVTGHAYGHAKRPWLWSAPPAEKAAPEEDSFSELSVAVLREATDAEIAGIISQAPGGEYLSGAQKLQMARHLLDNFHIEVEA